MSSPEQRTVSPEFLAALNRILSDDWSRARAAAGDEGTARFAEWEAEDGWLVSYTTSRVDGGEFSGRFLVIAHRPVGPGARSGRGAAGTWRLAYSRAFATRRAAKARAVALYRQHSPRWDARHPQQPGTALPPYDPAQDPAIPPEGGVYRRPRS